MFKEEVGLVRWFVKELIVTFILFVALPALIILALVGTISGITWKIILGIVLAYITFWVIVKVVLHFHMKKWEKEHQQKMQKENEVKYIIIK